MLNTLGEILPRAAALFGDKTALIIENRSYTYSALESLTNRFANGLRGLGVQPGDCVSIYSGNALEWIVSYHAALKCGAVVNPINVMLTPDEVRFVTSDCGASIIVAPQDKADPLLSLKSDTPLEHVVVFGGRIAGAQSFDDLVLRGQEEFVPVSRSPSDPSTIAYTSGTTGHPKGAMLSHRAVVLNSAMTANVHARTSADTVVTALPCAHVYGNVVMNGALLTGMTLVLMPRFDPAIALDLIEQHRATMFEGVPTMYLYILNEPALGRHHLSTLTRCTVGGQTMPVAKAEEVEALFGCALLELWGMTEIAGLGTTHPVYGFNRHGSIGIALPYVECSTADGNSQTFVCKEKGIKSYPTWIFADGSELTGEQSFATLAEKTSCTAFLPGKTASGTGVK